jgi:Protein of unknown function (DUF3592)
MKNRQKIIGFLVMFNLIAGSLACRSKLTAETTGTVIKAEAIKERKSTRRKTAWGGTRRTTKTVTTGTDIDYTYEVNGIKYSEVSEWDGNVLSKFKKDSQVKVCYNPENPEESDLFLPEEKCE